MEKSMLDIPLMDVILENSEGETIHTTLPVGDEELNKIVEKIGEYKISVFGCSIIGVINCVTEDTNICWLNERAKELHDMTDEQLEVVSAYILYLGNDLESAIYVAENKNFIVYYDCHTSHDVANIKKEEIDCLTNIPKWLKHFNFEHYVLNLEREGRLIQVNTNNLDGIIEIL